jgi:hypothetical protein
MKIDIAGCSLPSLGSTTVTLSIRNGPAFGLSCRAGFLLQAARNVATGDNIATQPSNHPRRETAAPPGGSAALSIVLNTARFPSADGEPGAAIPSQWNDEHHAAVCEQASHRRASVAFSLSLHNRRSSTIVKTRERLDLKSQVH